ncbi:unnamed protein product [Pleuronectes platessa]|uniref:Uncharacterized protein n=1 Tax=Pleuronectes platessa TaxID=8262 RepID=A0A9N7UTF5_PLEPL|nr:unnamed protein product [Pleuronectes platessa]
MSHNFSEQFLVKPMLPKDISQSREGWAKRDRAKLKTASAKFDTAPNTVPVPKRAKSTVNTERDLQKCTDKKKSSMTSQLQVSSLQQRQYFKMRRNRLGKEYWVNIKLQPGRITHTFQKDGHSCVIFVMQMAKMTVKEFPKIPEMFQVDSSEHISSKSKKRYGR